MSDLRAKLREDWLDVLLHVLGGAAASALLLAWWIPGWAVPAFLMLLFGLAREARQVNTFGTWNAVEATAWGVGGALGGLLW